MREYQTLLVLLTTQKCIPRSMLLSTSMAKFGLDAEDGQHVAVANAYLKANPSQPVFAASAQDSQGDDELSSYVSGGHA